MKGKSRKSNRKARNKLWVTPLLQAKALLATWFTVFLDWRSAIPLSVRTAGRIILYLPRVITDNGPGQEGSSRNLWRLRCTGECLLLQLLKHGILPSFSASLSNASLPLCIRRGNVGRSRVPRLNQIPRRGKRSRIFLPDAKKRNHNSM